jgi:hypothetical protein
MFTSLRTRFGTRVVDAAVAPRGWSWLWWTFGVLAAIRLWALQGQPLVAIANFVHDDRLFMDLASSILSGEWLGPYHERTLIKGPAFPLWIALTFVLGVPLRFAQNLLYVAACAIFIVAIRPALPRVGKSTWALLCVLLLFNPMPFVADASWTRPVREGIYSSLSMLVAATAIGLFIRADRSLATSAVWAASLGVSMSALWLTREEGIWIVPYLIALLACAALRVWRSPQRRARLALCALPLSIWAAAVLALCWLNLRHYGVFTTVEVKQRDFLAGYGALARVKHAHEEQSYYPPPPDGYIVVPKEARRRIYAASPAFAELERFLEGDIGRQYASAVCAYDAAACANIDIGSGHFLWALRAAVQAAGYHDSASQAAAYYRRLAAEITRACEANKIACGPERATMAPPWRSYFIGPVLQTTGRVALFAVSSFQGGAPHGGPSVGDEPTLNLFRDLSHERVAKATGGPLRRIQGWAFDTASGLTLSVRTHSGDLADATIRVTQRPDVFEAYRRSGLEMATARDAGFEILTPCVTGCDLYVRKGLPLAEARWIKVLPLEDPRREFHSGELAVSIDDSTIVSTAATLPRQDRVAQQKREMITAGRSIFQYLMYPLTLLALGYVPFGIAAALVKRQDWIPVVISVSLLGATMSRVALLAVIHVTSFPCAFSPHYLGATYLMLVMFVGVSTAASVGLAREWSWDIVWPPRRSLALARLRESSSRDRRLERSSGGAVPGSVGKR